MKPMRSRSLFTAVVILAAVAMVWVMNARPESTPATAGAGAETAWNFSNPMQMLGVLLLAAICWRILRQWVDEMRESDF